METRRPTCGRCGVYRHLHPTKSGCTRPRLSFWWDRHSPARHLGAHLWLALPEKRRWDVVTWLHQRRPHLCWCEFVDAAMLDDKKGDYRGDRGCACEVPLPFDVGEPSPGGCYCAPAGV